MKKDLKDLAITTNTWTKEGKERSDELHEARAEGTPTNAVEAVCVGILSKPYPIFEEDHSKYRGSVHAKRLVGGVTNIPSGTLVSGTCP